MKTLTKAEEEVMHALWKIEKGFLKDIVEAISGPRPNSSTIATLLKILVEKGFVIVTVYGRQHQYATAVNKSTYSSQTISQLAKSYFDNSFANIISFLVSEKNVSVTELEKLLKKVKQEKNRKK